MTTYLTAEAISKLRTYKTTHAAFTLPLTDRKKVFADTGEAREALETCNALSVQGHSKYGDLEIETLRSLHGVDTGTVKSAIDLLVLLKKELAALQDVIRDFKGSVDRRETSAAATIEEDTEIAKIQAHIFCSRHLDELSQMEAAYKALIARLTQRIGDCQGSLKPSAASRMVGFVSSAKSFGIVFVYTPPKTGDARHPYASAFDVIVEKVKMINEWRAAQFGLNSAYDAAHFYMALRDSGVTTIENRHIDMLVLQEETKIELGLKAQKEIEAFQEEVSETIRSFEAVTNPGSKTTSDLRAQYEFCSDPNRLNYLKTLQHMLPLVHARFSDRLSKVPQAFESYKTHHFDRGLPNLSQQEFEEKSQAMAEQKGSYESELRELELQFAKLCGKEEPAPTTPLEKYEAEDVSSLTRQLERLTLDNTELLGQIEAAKAAIKEAEESLNSLAREISEINERFPILKKETDQTLAKIKALSEDLGEESIDTLDAEEIARSLEAFADTLEANKASEEETVDSLSKKRETLAAAFSALEVQAETAKRECSSYEFKHDQELTLLQTSLKRAKESHIALSLKFEELMQTLNAIKKEREEEEEKTTPKEFDIVWERDSSVKSLREKLASVKDMNEEVAALEERVIGAQDQLTRDKEQILEEAQKTIEEFHRIIAELAETQAEIEKLSRAASKEAPPVKKHKSTSKEEVEPALTLPVFEGTMHSPFSELKLKLASLATEKEGKEITLARMKKELAALQEKKC